MTDNEKRPTKGERDIRKLYGEQSKPAADGVLSGLRELAATDPVLSPEPMLSPEELAHALGLSRRTIRGFCESEGWPHYRFGQKIKFRLSEVLEAARNRNPGQVAHCQTRRGT